jgi:hypothetical protein
MAKKTIEPSEDMDTIEEPVDTRTSDEKMADRIAEGVAKGIAQSAPKKVSFARYDPKTSWQKDTPKKLMPKLKRPCFQNGQMMDDGKMTAEEINLMNGLDTPGRFIDRRVEVIIREDGTQKVVELRYSDTVNQMMELRDKVRVAKSESPLANILYHIMEEAKGVLAS